MTPEELQSALAERQAQVESIMQNRMSPDAASGAAPDPEAVTAASQAPIADPWQQKLDQTRAAMSRNGIADPDEDRGAIMNFLGAANHRILQMITSLSYGVNPGQVVGEIARKAGQRVDQGVSQNYLDALTEAGTDFLNGKTDVGGVLQNVTQKLGITTEAQKGLAATLGESTVDAVIMSSALVAGAERLAGTQGNRWWQLVTRGLGEAIQQNPKMAVIADLGANVGSRSAEEAVGPDANPAVKGVAGIAGGFAGALGVGGVANVGGKALRLATAPVRGVARMLGADARPPDSVLQAAGRDATLGEKVGGALGMRYREPLQTEPLFDPAVANSPAAKNFAEQQVQGAQLQMEDAVDRAISGIRVPTSPRGAEIPATEMATRVRTNLDEAYKTARGIERDFWNNTPLQAKVPERFILDRVDALEADLNASSAMAHKPVDTIAELRSLYYPKQPGNPLPTVQRLRAVASDLGEKMAAEPTALSLNRNRARIQTAINDAIGDVLPDDVTIQQARSVSKTVNDMFSRGPIEEVRAMSHGDTRVPPGLTVEALMKKFEGIDSVLTMSRDLQRVPRRFQQDNAYPYADGSMMYKASGKPQELVNNLEGAIRAMVKEEATQNGPAAAVKFIQRAEPQIRPLARATAELTQTADYLAAHLENKNIIGRSNVARFAQTDDMDKAIQGFWNSRTPASTAKELMNTFRHDQEATDVFRQGILKRLFDSTKGDFNRVNNALSTPRFRDALEAVLSPEQMTRLRTTTENAIRFSKGDDRAPLRGFIARRLTIGGRLLGAMVGRRLETGTLQAPHYFSRAFGGAVEKLFKVADPQQMFANAIVDPRWERILAERVPTNTTEMRQLSRNLRRTISAFEGVKQATTYTPQGENNAE